MARKVEPSSELTSAAEALEEELRRFEAHADSAAHAPLRSRKNLERAARQLEEVADSDERLTRGVQALLGAIQRAKLRKDEQVAEISAAAVRLQERTARYQQLMEQYARLGHAASELNDSAEGGEVTSPSEAAGTLFDRMGELAAQAQALAEAAREDDFDDVSQSADGLRQQLLTLRNKLRLLAGREENLPV